MDVRNCKMCGAMYNHISGPPLCASCKKLQEEKFKVTRHYIRKNPHAQLAEISADCDVDIRQIREWIREERLSFSKDSAIGIECEMCGKTIRTGRFCSTCKESLISGIEKHTKKPQAAVVENPFAKGDGKSKMRFLDKKDKK